VRTAFNDLKHHSETLDELKIFLKEKKKGACAGKKKGRVRKSSYQLLQLNYINVTRIKEHKALGIFIVSCSLPCKIQNVTQKDSYAQIFNIYS
jgi:hypothetical protein